jgi:CubicO group peptidase (beta-lactamase class C family)
MRKVWFARAFAVSTFCFLNSSSVAQSTRVQRASIVENHLTHYVILKNSDHPYMQLASQMKAMHVPAVSMAAVRNGKIDWAEAYGVTSLEASHVTTRTLFGAASLSKPLTAVGVLKLVEQGNIDLDTDVNQYLKRWKIPENEFTREKKVTVRELLNHTSGIATRNGDLYDPAQPIPTIVQMLNGEKPAKNPPVSVEVVPGTKWAYSNRGYLVLALLIEDVTGETFSKYMKRAVLEPIGMTSSTFASPLTTPWVARAATCYWEDGRSGIPPEKFVEPNLAAGGLWSTPTDLAKFLIEIQREYKGTSHKLLHQETVQMLSKPGLGNWGLGFKIGGSPANPLLSHEGSGVFQDDMLIDLNGNGFVVMTSGGGGGGLADELIRSAGQVYDFPDHRPLERIAVDVSPEILSRYPGTYGFVKVAMNGERLTAEIPEGTRPQQLYAESPTRFFVLDGPQELQFDRQDNKPNSVEFITPMGHHALKRSDENGK